MYTLGEKLRTQRLAKGIDLAQIAAATRISSRYLQALESGETKVLPGSVFAKSFARQYASFVQLDEAEIEGDLQVAFPPENNVPVLEELNRNPERGPIRVAPLPDAVGASIPDQPQIYKSVIALLAVIAACSGVFMGWQRWRNGSTDELRIFAESSPPLNEPAQATTPPAGSEPEPAQPASPVSTTAAESTEATPTAIELSVPGSNGATGMAVRVVASEKTWLSINVNGHSVFRGLLPANEARVITGVQRAQMVIGNAGAVEVITDGKSIGPIGPPGQVRRVLLTPEGPQILRTSESKRHADEGTS
jgi:cytoskeletal protein RodZ